MATSVTFNGVVYQIPALGDEDWGENTSDFLIAIPAGAFQKTGGTFTLTADANFGANYGLLSKYFGTRTALPSTAGVVRLAVGDSIGWRNNANGANLLLGVNGSNQLTFGGSAIIPGGITALTGDVTATGPGSVAATIAANAVSNAKFRQSAALSVVGNATNSTTDVADIAAGTDNYVLRRSGTALGFGLLVNANIDAAAAIAYSKLALTGSIVNADVNASAAIAYSKLALTGTIVNADISGSAAIAYSKLNLTGTIVNADISASAAIAYSKLNLATSIVNADISTSAAIAYSKLALTGSILNADINASAAIAYSKLALTGSILNADINASAAIAYSKLALTGTIVNADISASADISRLKFATGTANVLIVNGSNGRMAEAGVITGSKALVSDVNGIPVASITTDTEITYVNGVTSPIQTQLNAKGTVSSVAMTVPAFLSIAGSPVTGSGTLAVSYSGTALPIANGGTAVTSVTTAPAASSFAGWDANSNLSASNFLGGYATTVTAAGTTTLVVGSKYQQFFTGSTTQTVVLPVASTLVLGQSFLIVNNSSGAVTVNSSGSNLVTTVAANSATAIVCILTSGTAAASWSVVSYTATAISAATASTTMGRDASANTYINNVIPNQTITATAAGTTTLVVGSAFSQIFTGSTTQTVKLPVASTLTLGHQFEIWNQSTGALAIQSSGANAITSMVGASISFNQGSYALFTCILTSGTTAASWACQYFPAQETTSASASTLAVRDANKNLGANNFINNFTSTATAGGTTTITKTGSYCQQFTGTSNQSFVLPNSCANGQTYLVVNRSTGTISVFQTDGTTQLYSVAPGTQCQFVCTNGGSELWVALASSNTRIPINYIGGNPDAELGVATSDTLGWATYADAAGNIPVDGTGGSATNLTFTRSTTSPLRGMASFSMAQANSTSLQGKGVAYNFSIDSADQAKVLAVSFDFIASATFLASNGVTPPLNDGTTTTTAGNSDIEVFVYDVTNARLLYVSPQVITANGANSFTFKGEFQTAPNSTSYRLIFHIATTSANATGWSFKFDNVVVAPNALNFGPPVTDWQAYTPTFAGLGTCTSVAFFYRRVGDTLEIQGNATTGTVPASAATFTIPTGLAFDSAKVTIGSGLVGDSTTSISGTSAVRNSASLFIAAAATNTISFSNVGDGSVSKNLSQLNGTTIFPNATVFSVWAKVPISGWSSTTQMSNDSTTRVVEMKAYASTPTGTLNGSFNTVIYGTLSTDTHAGYNATTGVYTIPVSGFYNVVGSILVAGTVAAGNRIICKVYVNGARTFNSSINRAYAGSQSPNQATVVANNLQLKAGDLVTIQSFSEYTSPTYSADDDANFFTVTQVTGPSTIAASESVNAIYGLNANQAVTAANILKYDTKVRDTHNGFSTSTGLYTCPSSGMYMVAINTSVTTTAVADMWVKISGVDKGYILSTINASQIYSGMALYPCVAGDTIGIYSDASLTFGGIATHGYINSLSIARVGN